MNMKKDIFNRLENAGEDDMMELMKFTPEFDSETAERLLDRSEQKYRARKKDEAGIRDEYETEISGVETYRRPVWSRALPVAASLVLLAGVAALTGNLLRDRNDPVGPDDPNPPVIAASTEDTTSPTPAAEGTTQATDVTGTGTSAETGETATAAAETVVTAVGQGSGTAASAAVQTVTAAETTKAAGTSAVTPSAPETPEEMIDRLGREGYIEDPEYTAIAKDLLTRYENIYRVCCSPEYSYFDFSDSFDVTYNEPGMDGPAERTVTFVRYNDPDFSSYAEIHDCLYKTLVKDQDIYENGIGEWGIGNSIAPGSYIDCNDPFPRTTEYNGKLYANPEHCRNNPENVEYNPPYTEFYLDKPMFIEHEDDGSFSVWVLSKNCNYGQTSIPELNEHPYCFNHVYFIKHNGAWGVYENWVATFDEYVNAMTEHIGIPE